ncbi:GNAT family N-acetyltransferase [Cryobacterium sp. Y57]|uniref:GNAT family N-acetyltransferase n=1 Tax=Cryobacterium sp. Y57 TaxID=2048287 RepID=UPI00351A1786
MEQLSVAPGDARKGWGRALVEAAKIQAQKRGYHRISLRTYADVPWNAPFYASAGFVEEEPATQFHRSLVGIEGELGLDRYGRRVQMVAHVEAPGCICRAVASGIRASERGRMGWIQHEQ